MTDTTKEIMTDTEDKRKFKDVSYPDFIVGFSKNEPDDEIEDWVIKGDNMRLEHIEEMSFKLQFKSIDGFSFDKYGSGYSLHLNTDQVDDILEVFIQAAADGTLKEWLKGTYGLHQHIERIKDTRPEEEQPKLIAEAEADFEEQYSHKGGYSY